MTQTTVLSVCIPVYNEEENVRACYESLKPILDGLGPDLAWEMVFTDNHSTDATFTLLCTLAKEDPRVRVFRFSKNFGYQRSILTAYLKARGDAVIQMDVDLQDPPEMIPEFVRLWREGHDVVYGVRRTRKEGRAITWARRAFYHLVRRLSEDELPLEAGDFRLLDRKIVTLLAGMEDAQPYLRGSIAAMGFSQVGVPYDRRARERGQSKFSFGALVGLALDGILNHSVIPLRVATFIGLAVSLLTLLMILGYIVAKLVVGLSMPPGFPTIVVLLLGSLSLNALFLGIIGEYLGRIYKQVKRKPITIIEASIDEAPSGPVGVPVDTLGVADCSQGHDMDLKH